jgi:hypothetical protein
MDLGSIIPPYWISAGILIAALIMFVSERVRHDLVALLALLTAVATGLVAPKDALDGFGDPAVVAVAYVQAVSRGGLRAWPCRRKGDSAYSWLC